MKIKTSEATQLRLDWLVAKIDNRKIGFNLGGGLEVRGRTEDGEELPEQWDLWMPWHPSTDWVQGGPIIEREEIEIRTTHTGGWMANRARTKGDFEVGPTPLIAAMRCYVASKLGDEVEVPANVKVRSP